MYVCDWVHAYIPVRGFGYSITSIAIAQPAPDPGFETRFSTKCGLQRWGRERINESGSMCAANKG